PVSPTATTRGSPARRTTSSHSPGAAWAAWLGWTPAVANTAGGRGARARLAGGGGAGGGAATTRGTPAAGARASTSGRSAANCPSSRCAWVSIRVSTSGDRRFGGGGVQRLQLAQVQPLDPQQPLQLGPGLRVGHAGGVLLQPGQRRP